MTNTTLLEVGGALFIILEDDEHATIEERCIDPDADLLEALDLLGAEDSQA